MLNILVIFAQTAAEHLVFSRVHTLATCPHKGVRLMSETCEAWKTPVSLWTESQMSRDATARWHNFFFVHWMNWRKDYSWSFKRSQVAQFYLSRAGNVSGMVSTYVEWPDVRLFVTADSACHAGFLNLIVGVWVALNFVSKRCIRFVCG